MRILLLIDNRATLQYQYCSIQKIYCKRHQMAITFTKESLLPFGSCNLVVVVEPSKQYRNPLTSFSYSLLIPLPTFQPWVGSLPCAEKISTKGPPCNTNPHIIIKMSGLFSKYISKQILSSWDNQNTRQKQIFNVKWLNYKPLN